jgi:hypothetical protein
MGESLEILWKICCKKFQELSHELSARFDDIKMYSFFSPKKIFDGKYYFYRLDL